MNKLRIKIDKLQTTTVTITRMQFVGAATIPDISRRIVRKELHDLKIEEVNAEETAGDTGAPIVVEGIVEEEDEVETTLESTPSRK